MATSPREISTLRKLCRDMAPDGSLERCFHSGLVLGFNEVITILQQPVLQLMIIPFHRTWPSDSVNPMNRDIARALIDEELKKLRKLSYTELLKALNRASTTTVKGRDGETYQVEWQAFWDGKKRGNIRVLVCVDDGGLSAFKPLSGAFIISPDGSFIGE